MLRLDFDDVEERTGEDEIVVAALDDSSIDDMMKVKEGKDKPPRTLGKYVKKGYNRT